MLVSFLWELSYNFIEIDLAEHPARSFHSIIFTFFLSVKDSLHHSILTFRSSQAMCALSSNSSNAKNASMIPFPGTTGP